MAFHRETQNWQRVRLLDFFVKTKMVLVYFVDYPLLKSTHLPVDSLWELPGEIAGCPVVPVYKAYLYDVYPAAGGFSWNAKVVDWFKKQAIKGSVWVGLQMTWKARRVDHGPDQSIKVGIVLFEDSDSPDRSKSLNFRLVRCGHASALGIG